MKARTLRRYLRLLTGPLLRKALALRYRRYSPDHHRRALVRVAGLRVIVEPGVFDPSLHFTSAYFVSYLREQRVVPPNRPVLDLGTGTGVLAIAAALAGGSPVVGVDISPAAVNCALANVSRYGLSSAIEIRQGDLFAPVHDMRFDLVVCNPPYLRGEAHTIAQRAYWGGSDLGWFRKFFSELPSHLHEGGRAILSLSDTADLGSMKAIAEECGCMLTTLAERDILVERIMLVEARSRGNN